MKILKCLQYILFVLFISNLNSQVRRFVYEYRFNLDSTKTNTIQKEIYFLDSNKNGSIYYNEEEEATNDSLLKKDNESSVLFKDKIIKSYPEYTMNQATKISADYYLVSDTRILKWEIKEQKEKISDYNAQKATTNFMGRNWTAWFTTEIPIQDGPYKFHGLPGLILKLEDNTSSHIFEIIAIKNSAFERKFEFRSNYIKIDYAQYKKLFHEHLQNPTKKLMGNEILNTQDGISGNEFKRNMMKYYKNQLSKQNNILEIDLLK